MTEGLPAPAPASGGRRRAELLADIAASAIPYSGPLRDVSEFREYAALNRPSILRRVAADLAAEVPRDAGGLVAAGWRAAVLATALSLHTGLPLSIATGPEAGPAGGAAVGGDGLAPGRSVVLVTTSTAGDAEVGAWITGLAELGIRVVGVLSLLAPAARGRAAGDGGTGSSPPRTALLTEEELAVSTSGGRP
ncbi:hypothetical protein ACFY4C_36270 [Actinomadura viridis]|uniref:hypothetical protein n=1 Tax=Actinomadura viridis TaxID=58110 RepID=UPI0036ADAC6F